MTLGVTDKLQQTRINPELVTKCTAKVKHSDSVKLINVPTLTSARTK